MLKCRVFSAVRRPLLSRSSNIPNLLDQLLVLPRISKPAVPTMALGDGIVLDPDDPRRGDRWFWMAILLGYPPPKPPVNASPLYLRFRDTWDVPSVNEWLCSELERVRTRPGRVLPAGLAAYRPGRGAALHKVFVNVPPHRHARRYLKDLLESLNTRSHIRDHGITIRGKLGFDGGS